jgi:tyrosine phenol-lyase
MERGAVPAGREVQIAENRCPKIELVRLMIPRCVYTQAHMDVTAESVMGVFEERDSVRRIEFKYEPVYLRFFQARFGTVGSDGIFAWSMGHQDEPHAQGPPRPSGPCG